MLLRLLLVLLGLACLATELHAQEPGGPRDAPSDIAARDMVRSLGGPDSVNSALRRSAEPKETYFRFNVLDKALRPWDRFKKRLKDCHHLSIGTDYNFLREGASAGLGETNASGGVFRFYAHWTVTGRNRANQGEFLFRIENRHAIGGYVAPEKLGAEIGSLYKTANSFADFGWGITNLQWQQWFGHHRFGVAIGQVDLRDWVDTFDLSNWREALLSAAVTYPVTHLPSAGLGAAFWAYFRSRNTVFVNGGIGDANGHPDELGFDTFFNDAEYYTFCELGWTPDPEEENAKHIRFTAWHQDPRTKEGIPEGWGATFSGCWRFGPNERWAPFIRGGYAEGGVIPARKAIVGGIGLHRRSHDLAGTAISWAEPWESGLRNQVTLETFYRFQLSEHLGVTPDLQMIWNPSNNPGESWIGVLGLRVQLLL